MQKSFCFLFFTFYLLPFGLCLSICLVSCKLNPNVQTPGESYLQGEWQQDSVASQKLLVSYSLYHFKFSCDSFFVAIESYSKVNTGPDTCMLSGRWAEYCKGTYSQKQDTLHLKGQFCNADFTIKDDKGCFRSGDYEEIFTVAKKSDKLVRFASTSDVIPIDARLVKRLSCNPKPL